MSNFCKLKYFNHKVTLHSYSLAVCLRLHTYAVAAHKNPWRRNCQDVCQLLGFRIPKFRVKLRLNTDFSLIVWGNAVGFKLASKIKWSSPHIKICKRYETFQSSHFILILKAYFVKYLNFITYAYYTWWFLLIQCLPTRYLWKIWMWNLSLIIRIYLS